LTTLRNLLRQTVDRWGRERVVAAIKCSANRSPRPAEVFSETTARLEDRTHTALQEAWDDAKTTVAQNEACYILMTALANGSELPTEQYRQEWEHYTADVREDGGDACA